VTSETESQKGEEREFESLDFSPMHFPSDQLTVLRLRRLHPELFDHGFQTGDAQPKYFFDLESAESGIGSLLFKERLIATGAYAAARGLPGPKDWDEDLELYKKELVSDLCFYGLASGVHEAVEMIRDIERQATQLSRKISR
jgi:hypothetical protein